MPSVIRQTGVLGGDWKKIAVSDDMNCKQCGYKQLGPFGRSCKVYLDAVKKCHDLQAPDTDWQLHVDSELVEKLQAVEEPVSRDVLEKLVSIIMKNRESIYRPNRGKLTS